MWKDGKMYLMRKLYRDDILEKKGEFEFADEISILFHLSFHFDVDTFGFETIGNVRFKV